ncbi:MAG: ATP-binding cassette domain-containing protein [Ruminococcus sp.]
MLELKGIRKVYPAGGENVQALKGIDLTFRESEFVSILGPSGCGKTTMLNIIGGLDHYTAGDLIINGKSTKDFKDRDWDAYRNHSIGFVFQSYNLIPHQTVLQNVELALTLSGVSKSERRERAKKALEEVGLGNQLKKRPSEMSGGQMQRVAIARAIVNNPDIILADEPTGALDTETSVQVMEILKAISKNRLVIMVTHNPELAEKYSTRIIRMLDGEITGDSAPLTEEEAASERESSLKRAESEKGKKKPSMSFATSFGLSLKNLFTKKGRTTLTSFAGSIGIIGIALIFSVSQGTTTYIDTVQEETLSSYPLTLEAQHIDMGSLMQTFIGAGQSAGDHDKDAVYKTSAFYDMINSLNSLETQENDLKSFKKYIEERVADENDESGLRDAVNGIQYSYDLDMLVYTENVDGTIIRSDTQQLMQEIISEYMGMDMAMMSGSPVAGTSTISSLMSGSMNMGAQLWQEMLPGDNGALVSDLIENQYDMVYGSWPAQYNEIVLVLNENNELDDMTLYALGLLPKEDLITMIDAATYGNELKVEEKSWSYEEICAMDFVTILNSDCYQYDEATETYTDLRDTDAGLKYLYSNGIPLKVTGIIRPNEDAVSTMLTGSIAYTSELTKYIINNSADSEAVKAQLASPETDILTGLPFSNNSGSLSDAEKAAEFRKYTDFLTDTEKGRIYIEMMSVPSDEYLQAAVDQSIGMMTRPEMEAMMIQNLTAEMGIDEETIRGYISAMSDEEFDQMMTQAITEQATAQYAAEVASQMAAMTPEQLIASFNESIRNLTDEQAALYYDSVLEFSDTTYEDNLKKLGCIDLESPATINIYASSFENKDIIEDAIADYNSNVDDLSEIEYTDYVGIMMSSVTTIINAITYVLIAFVAISLIVSSIMIGVITLISVQERTKEIGILRAIGASKKNVSRMFNAETLIIGFTSGLLGVLITALLCIPINIVIHFVTGINNLSAFLPIPAAITLVVISMLLTLISGIIPSKSAAKKDPVVALRTE